ncbi:hypothetical protein OPT61_g3924 [Boeremia exigua]|uniref:Uncharacterized protein n=1 Tax=Boeremia exigua TaxID=749465 RepID=A0ACC2IFZ5_9PLEO|nr:hypothetical protein OPT61_g3924 [Boeremia exigua]
MSAHTNLIAITLGFTLLITRTQALPSPASVRVQDSFGDNGWSTESVLGLIAIIVAILCCGMGMLWPSLLRCLRLRRARSAALPQTQVMRRRYPIDGYTTHTRQDNSSWQRQISGVRLVIYSVNVHQIELGLGRASR